MKRKVSAANLSIAITFLLILLSFGFGYRSYSQAEQRVVSDLNQALQRTVLQNKGLWLNADTIQTYAKLQEVIGAPVSVNGSHRAYRRSRAGSLHIHDPYRRGSHQEDGSAAGSP